MAQDATLHIKVEPSTAKALKGLARKRRKTMGELVRQAINEKYQAEFVGLTQQQNNALAAYRGGYISIGKLAEEMGMHVLDIRVWLNEHGIPQNTDYETPHA